MTQRIITRAEWGAADDSVPPVRMRLPAGVVYIHHSTTNVTADPARDMREIERTGVNRPDIRQLSYSYVIHPHDGEILEGCGLFRGAHTIQRNSNAFGICWAGNYEERAPKIQQVEATRWLIHHLREQGHLSHAAPIYGHRDVVKTACPGNKLYALLDVIRLPWEGPMPIDDPNRVNVNAPIVGIAGFVTADGKQGYWLVGADGGVFPFGEAKLLGTVEYVKPDDRAWLPKA